MADGVFGHGRRVSFCDDLAGRIATGVARYRDDHGASVLWVGHDPAQRKRVADSELSIVDGTVV